MSPKVLFTRSATRPLDPAVVYMICPRCGLSIEARIRWLASRHCPRCLARSRMAVELFSSQLPAALLYADGAPSPAGDGASPGERANMLEGENPRDAPLTPDGIG